MSKLLLIGALFLVLVIPVYLLNKLIVPFLNRLLTGTSQDDVDAVIAAKQDLGEKVKQEKQELQKRVKELSELEKKEKF